MTINALADSVLNPRPALPPMEFVGPTVDDDIRRAIGRYGAEKVKVAVKRQTTAKVGRPKVNDWKELHPIIEEDARIWLEGGEPFTARSNYAIAKAVADENPGHSHPATMKRILRKLKQQKGREWLTFTSAWMKSEKSWPHGAHLRALRVLCELDPRGAWPRLLEFAEGTVADYTAKHGEPAKNLTMKEIEEGARTPLNALLSGLDRFQPQRRAGLLDLSIPPQGGKPAGNAALPAQAAGPGE